MITDSRIDYSKKRHWAFLPKENKPKQPVDVLFFYPTIYKHPFHKRRHHMGLVNPVYRVWAKTVSAWEGQLFARQCNFYVPYYRQVGMECFKMTIEEFLSNMRKPYEDVRDAFFYYLKHYNEGRPFILAGHSQGSAHLMELMAREFTDPELSEKLVAAYLIGYSLVNKQLEMYPHLKIAQNDRDTGVIITYNTTAKDLPLMRFLREDSACVNPLSWKQDFAYADRSLNEGAVLFDLGGKLKFEVPHATGAYVDKQRGVLVIDDDVTYQLFRLRKGVRKVFMNRDSLHMMDIPLFHRNLERNVRTRIEQYFSEHPEFAPETPTAL